MTKSANSHDKQTGQHLHGVTPPAKNGVTQAMRYGTGAPQSGNDLRLKDVLSREELRAFGTANWHQPVTMITGNILILATAFALAILWPNPVTVLLAVLLIAGRQMGFAILLHECAHHSFFPAKQANIWFGRLLAGGIICVSLDGYRDYHLNHHRNAGTMADPDLKLVSGYPATPASMRRKFTRDLGGLNGIKEMIFLLKIADKYTLSGFVLSQALLFLVLYSAGAAWAYLLWWVARIFVMPAMMRLRIIGEHGTVPNRLAKHARLNTHTTIARWWEKLFIMPNNVNYHLEHHQFAQVPNYKLPTLHRLLKSRGWYDGYDCYTLGYPALFKKAMASQDAINAQADRMREQAI